MVVTLFQSFSSLNKTEDERVCSFYEPIDVVFTWVNGSDPEFIKNLNQYFPNSDYQPSRYQGLYFKLYVGQENQFESQKLKCPLCLKHFKSLLGC